MAGPAKRRDTGSLIADELTRASRPLSAYDLLDRLRPEGVTAPTTVYRALDKLLASGKVHRIESLNAFVACRGAEGGPHEHAHGALAAAFTVCDRCAAVAEFVDPALRARIEAAAAAGAFRPRASVVEIRGLCAACADGRTPDA